MRSVAVGDNAAVDNGMYLTRSSATLVMARPSGYSSGSGENSVAGGNGPRDAGRLGAAMAELVKALPRVTGSDAVMPMLPGLLPKKGLATETVHYAIGAAAYSGPLPVSAIDFSRDAEVVTGQYRVGRGAEATLSLIMSPTPAIAADSLQMVKALPDAALHAAVKQAGPLIEVVSGARVSADEAKKLLAQVHFGTKVTLDQPQGYTSEVAKAAKLLLGIGLMTAAMALAALVIAVFLGSGRLLIRRLRGKPDSAMNDDDFIRLDI